MFQGTPASIELCTRMSEISEGVCVLGFSRGKDSLAAWLFLKNFFHRIIPFHGSLVPGLGFVERSLAYYEEVFETKIERCISPICFAHGLQQLQFQLPGDEQSINDLGLWEYTEHNMGRLIADKYSVPFAWNAFAYSMYDSLDRIGWVKKCKGVHEKHVSFYPCFDWKPSQVLEYIQQHNVSLPEDYLMGGRTMCSSFDTCMMERMKELYPEDHEIVKLWFPLIEARLARNEFRKRKLKDDERTPGPSKLSSLPKSGTRKRTTSR